MKKQEVTLYLNLKIEGKEEKIMFDLSNMRAWLNNLRIKPDQKTVELKFDYDEKEYVNKIDIAKELPIIKKAIKYAELLKTIIPPCLEKYLMDYTQKLSQTKMAHLVGRNYEINKIWFYLSQKKRNNVFLIGEKDVGKTAIAREVTRQIATNECPREFYEKRVLVLRPELLIRMENNTLYEYKIKQLITFLTRNKDNIILYVDKAIYLKTDLMLASVLNTCVKRYNIPLITTSSEENFETYFLGDKNISKYVNYINIKEPEYDEIEPMIHKHIKKLERQYGIKCSKKMVNFGIYTSPLLNSVSANPGKVLNIFDRAFLEAKREEKEEIDKKSILSCYDSAIKEYEKTPEEGKRSTAYHETGHYLLSILNKNINNRKISCISILPTESWAGATVFYGDIKEYSIYSKEYFIDYIAGLLAGRIAERKFTKSDSIGAASDLERANDIARSMVMDWGLSEKPENRNRQYDIDFYFIMSEQKKEAIDKEVGEIIDEATKRAEKVIDENEELLKTIAEKLLEDEVISGKQLELICKEYKQSKNK